MSKARARDYWGTSNILHEARSRDAMTIKIDYEYGIPLCGPRPAKGAPLLKKVESNWKGSKVLGFGNSMEEETK